MAEPSGAFEMPSSGEPVFSLQRRSREIGGKAWRELFGSSRLPSVEADGGACAVQPKLPAYVGKEVEPLVPLSLGDMLDLQAAKELLQRLFETSIDDAST